MVSIFSLEWFLAAPSIELIDSCHKCDLLQIVYHFKPQVPTQVLKRELKVIVVDELVEAGLIEPDVSVVLNQDAMVVGDHKDEAMPPGPSTVAEKYEKIISFFFFFNEVGRQLEQMWTPDYKLFLPPCWSRGMRMLLLVCMLFVCKLTQTNHQNFIKCAQWAIEYPKIF